MTFHRSIATKLIAFTIALANDAAAGSLAHLTDEQVLERLRTVLYRDFLPFHRFHQIRSSDCHDVDGCVGTPTFSSRSIIGMLDDLAAGTGTPAWQPWQEQKLAAVRTAATRTERRYQVIAHQPMFSVAPKYHEGACPICGAKRALWSLVVSCEAAGRVLTLEYAL